MTREEKAKAYDEALGRAKSLFGNSPIGSERAKICSIIFPQLTESEDERIMEELIGALMWQRDCLDAKGPHDNNLILPGFTMKVGNILEWLEKQKEHLPIPDKFSELKSLMLQYLQSAANRKDDTEIESDTDLWGRKILDYVWKYSDEQKEQKPAESRKRNKPKESWLSNAKYEIEHADELLRQSQEELKEIRELKNQEQKSAEKQDYSGLNDLERAILRGFLAAGMENVPVTIIKETAKECLAQMEPAEWCDEDEKMLKWLCRIIHSRVVNKELSLAEESELGKWMDKWINHEPQHEKKWSEFDEDCLRRAIWYVENPAPSVVKDTNLVLWLQTLPGRFNLQPKQEWSEVELEFRGEKVKIKRPFFRDDKGRGYSTTEQDEEVAWNALRAWCEKKDISLYDLYPREEWSEEDKAIVGCIACYLDGQFISEGARRQCQEWFNRHRIDFLNSSSWKPSEEQMKALCSELPVVKGGGDKVQDILETLYDDLKKLI